MTLPNTLRGKEKVRALIGALMLGAASVALVACEPAARQAEYTEAEIQAETERLYAFFQKTFEEDVAESPIIQTYFGYKTDNDKWDDFSDAQNIEDYEQTKERLKTLASFDYDALSEDAKLSYRLYKLLGEREVAQFPYRFHSYPITQFFGWHSQMPVFLANFHRVEEAADAEAYIARLNESKRVFDQILEGLKVREDKGVMPPAWVHPYVVETIDNLLTGRPFDDSDADSDMLAAFKRKIEPLEISDGEKADLVARAEAALVENVQPAYAQLRDFMAAQQERAPTDDGVWRLPDGEAYYQLMLENYTTTDLTAEEIHQLGLENVERIHNEMRAIMEEVGFAGTLQEFFEFMRTDQQFYYENTDEGRERYLNEAKALIDTMRETLPEYFGILPEAGIVVKRVEPFREASAGKAFYNRPSQDGSRPGIYYANLRDMADMPVYQMEALAYHEGIPGHHMQIAISLELENVPEFQKQSGFTAYTEGWGLYSEYLPKDMGFYQDPYSDFGRLAMELWRACRLVVDTGIHAKRWSREQAMQYLRDNTPNPEGDIENAINRYVVYPGQATAYMIGKLKIVELRERAREELGDRFDIRAFHDQVLKRGAVPLNILEENIEAWIARVQSST